MWKKSWPRPPFLLSSKFFCRPSDVKGWQGKPPTWSEKVNRKKMHERHGQTKAETSAGVAQWGGVWKVGVE